MNLTNKQYLAIAMAILGVLAASSSQMSEFLGPNTSKAVAGGAGFVNTILAAIMAAITGQISQVRDVQAMPGVERIEVNTQDSPVLAVMAVSAQETKVTPQAGTGPTLERIAEGGA
jgi:hypothetical protein